MDSLTSTTKEKEVTKEGLTPQISYGVGSSSAPVAENVDHLQRRLGNRQIQLIAIGGSIGTGLFVSIGSGLRAAGPGGLLIASIVQCIMVALVGNGMAEMISFMPVSGGFVRLAGAYVDDAFGFMAGWNFFFYEALSIPFEISAVALVMNFWSDNIPVWAVVLACIILYAVLNILAVGVYGEAEFWLSGGKVILIFALFFFTFITMCGGNPQRDAYGFRSWRDPGPFSTYLSEGDLGRFQGFLAALYGTAFYIVGPEFLSMVSGEAKRPSVYMKTAFKTMYYRFAIFFLGSALCVGIVLPHDDLTLSSILTGDSSEAGTARASPYVIAMYNLGITSFPHVVNALLVTSIFSAGNTYVFCASRTLYGLALEGRAPKFLTKCTRKGIPIYCFFIVMIFGFLGFLQVNARTAGILSTIISLITAGTFVNYIVMSLTYIFFYRACKAQRVDRCGLPYTGYFQPYGAWIGLVYFTCIAGSYGYTSLQTWNITSFFGAYLMTIVAVILFAAWKVLKKTKLVQPHEADLVWERPVIQAYEESISTPPVGFWKEMLQLVGIGRLPGGNDQVLSSQL
ncbi:Amino acid permease-like protein 29 [Elsinoe fawcettii]|nr:Amino acid permease-like protein 29 [Elsinoe fawcettii]